MGKKRTILFSTTEGGTSTGAATSSEQPAMPPAVPGTEAAAGEASAEPQAPPQRRRKMAARRPSLVRIDDSPSASEEETSEPAPSAQPEEWKPSLAYSGHKVLSTDGMATSTRISHACTRALLLPSDMERYVGLPARLLAMNAEHNMCLAIQQLNALMESYGRIPAQLDKARAEEARLAHELKQSQAQLLEANARAEEANARAVEERTRAEEANARAGEAQSRAEAEAARADEAEKAREQEAARSKDELRSAQDLAKVGRKQAYDYGYSRATSSYIRQYAVGKEIFFSSGWKLALASVGQGDSPAYNAVPPPSIPEEMREESTRRAEEAGQLERDPEFESSSEDEP